MIFVVEFCIARKVIEEEGLDLVVSSPVGDQPVAGKDPLRIGVDYKDRHLACIQENGVCGLWADPGDLEKGLSDPRWFFPEHPLEAPPVSRAEKGEEVLESSGLDVKITRGTDQLRQATSRQG
jgi:hypothetical protein